MASSQTKTSFGDPPPEPKVILPPDVTEAGYHGRYLHLISRPQPHDCQLPGWWARRRGGVQPGSIWECGTCEAQFKLGTEGWARLKK